MKQAKGGCCGSGIVVGEVSISAGVVSLISDGIQYHCHFMMYYSKYITDFSLEKCLCLGKGVVHAPPKCKS